MNDLQHHPVVELFPPMTTEEFGALKADIAAHGLQDPCRTWQGLLIDGRHRLRACQELGVEPQLREWQGSEAEMVCFVVGLNLNRRHLTSSQKAAVAVDLDAIFVRLAAEAKERQQRGKSEDGQAGGRGKKYLPQHVGEGITGHAGEIAEQAAQMFGTNRQYVTDAKKLKAKAPDLHEEVKAGKLSVRAASAAVRRRETAQKKAEVQAEAQEQVVIDDERCRIDHADALDWFRSQPANSLHLVFGSPPYEQARLYLENGEDRGIARGTDAWVAWMVEVYQAALRCCTGLVAFVVEGQTKQYRWSASPVLLMAALHQAGIHLRKPPIYRRVGIPGSGGPDWLRNDYEFIICATRGGSLPWSDNTAMGQPPKYEPGGNPSHRRQDGSRVGAENGPATMADRDNVGHHRARFQAGSVYVPPEIANPGNVIACTVGGGQMGDSLAHENEAPFPEDLAEFFIRSFCPPGGIVCDPFSGSGTTAAVALRHGRRFAGCDIRQSQVELSCRRIARVQPLLPILGE